jgi:transposase
MAKARLPYPEEFRRKIVELYRAGRSVNELAEEFEPSDQTIRNWIAQAQADGGQRKDLLTSAEREELARLRRENKQLKVEREILAKATAWFAREADTTPKKSSGS